MKKENGNENGKMKRQQHGIKAKEKKESVALYRYHAPVAVVTVAVTHLWRGIRK